MHIVKVLTNIVKKHTRVNDFTAWNLEFTKNIRSKQHQHRRLFRHATQKCEALRHSHRPFTALSRANTYNHTSFSFSELRILPLQTGVHSDDQKSTKRHQQRARWLLRGYAWKWKHRQLPLRDTSQDRKQRGQYGSLVQWKPEELLSLCSYSCALWEVSAHWSLGQKRQVQRASSTLADRQNRGQTLRS